MIFLIDHHAQRLARCEQKCCVCRGSSASFADQLATDQVPLPQQEPVHGRHRGNVENFASRKRAGMLRCLPNAAQHRSTVRGPGAHAEAQTFQISRKANPGRKHHVGKGAVSFEPVEAPSGRNQIVDQCVTPHLPRAGESGPAALPRARNLPHPPHEPGYAAGALREARDPPRSSPAGGTPCPRAE